MVNESEAPRASWLQRILIGRNPKVTMARAAILAILCLLVSRFLLVPIQVKGGSMLPTYRERGVNFVNCVAYLFHGPRRYDVVAVRTTGRSILFMKRVIGLPGETVAFHEGRAWINGQPLDEPYVHYPCQWELPPQLLAADEYFCVGDNRSMAPDDHTFGAARRVRILGRVLL
jgi:signal peptidase I